MGGARGGECGHGCRIAAGASRALVRTPDVGAVTVSAVFAGADVCSTTMSLHATGGKG